MAAALTSTAAPAAPTAHPGNAGLVVTTPTDRTIVMTREFDAPRRLVFRAFTEPELVKQWLYGPDGWAFDVCEIDLRVGGAYRYHWAGPKGATLGLRGVYREVTRPEQLVHTERFDEPFDSGESLVTTTFVERDGRTTVAMTSQFDSQEMRDGVLQSGMADGVGVSYDRLEALLATLSPDADPAR
jgi:uncharacterized protein YndB with AHSA1/START domain